MMLESNVWGENSFLFIHTTWIGNDLLKIRKMNSAELILKTANSSAIALAAILKTRSARPLARCLLPAFLCALHSNRHSPVRNIPKFKDRELGQGRLVMRHFSTNEKARLCLSTNKSKHRRCDKMFSKQRTESDRISHRFEALRHIFKTFHEAYTIFLRGQRIGSHIGSVS